MATNPYKDQWYDAGSDPNALYTGAFDPNGYDATSAADLSSGMAPISSARLAHQLTNQIRSLGYTGSITGSDYSGQGGQDSTETAANMTLDPTFTRWMADNGYSLKWMLPSATNGGQTAGLVDKSGKVVAHQDTPDTALGDFLTAAVVAAGGYALGTGLAGAAAAGSAAGGAGGGTALTGVDAAMGDLAAAGGLTPNYVAAAGAAGGAGGAGGGLLSMPSSTGGALSAGSAAGGAGGGTALTGVDAAMGDLAAAGGLTPNYVAAAGAAGMTPSLTQVASGVSSAGSLSGGGNGSTAGSGGYTAAQNYGDGMSGAQTGAFDNVLNATGSTDLANLAGKVTGGAGSVWDWLSTAGSAVSGTNSLFSNPLLNTLIGAGVNQWNIEQAAEDQRKWQAEQDAAKRRRQMPGLLASAHLNVRKATNANT